MFEIKYVVIYPTFLRITIFLMHFLLIEIYYREKSSHNNCCSWLQNALTKNRNSLINLKPEGFYHDANKLVYKLINLDMVLHYILLNN